jgi:vacuolar-type H+-ATPase subunit E/Vma4
MVQHRLITAMEEEIAARIAQSDREADAAIRHIEAEAAAAEAEAIRAEQAHADQLFTAYQSRQQSRFENQWRLRVRNLQFEVSQRVFAAVEQSIVEARRRDDYPNIFGRLLAESLLTYANERSDRPILEVAPADRELAGSFHPSVEAIETSATICDGLALRSPDGRLHIMNTLSSRLRKGRDEFLKIISDALKEETPQ